MWPALGHIAKKQLSWLECRSWLLEQGSFHIIPYKLSRIEDFLKKHMLVYVCVCVCARTCIHTYVYRHIILLHFALLHLRYCMFYKLKICGHLASSKSISTIFPTAHFVFLCHILVNFAVFQAFPLLYL